MEHDMGQDVDPSVDVEDLDLPPEPTDEELDALPDAPWDDRPWASEDDATAGSSEPPPLPAGIDPTGGGQSVIGGPPAPEVDLSGGASAPLPGGMEGADLTTVPPGEPTGVQGDPPPLPIGIDGRGDPAGQSVIGRSPTDPLDTGAPRPGGMEGADLTTEPPGEPTGVQGDPPPLPEGIDATGGGQSVVGDQPGFFRDAPAPLSSEAASQLLSGLLPNMLAEDVEVAVAGAADDGTVDVNEVIDLLRAHGFQSTADAPASVSDVASTNANVHLLGHVDGTLVPLTVDGVDAERGLLRCLDPSGSTFDARVEDVDRAWRGAGGALLRMSDAPPAVPPTPTEVPTLHATPAVAVDSGDGTGLAAPMGAGAAVFLPVALGGGILARRLAHRR